MVDAVIKIENAVVVYRDSVALNGVSLKVDPGEFVGIIGPNGAGKTTLLTIVNGFTRLAGGQAWVLGQTVNGHNRHELRKQVGYVAQVENTDPRVPVNVREVVMMGRYGRLGLFHRPGASDRTVVDEALEMVGMSHLANRPIGQLSGGEQQRVGIARCLAQEPRIFLLDEPTASLDWKARADILELVKRIHDLRYLTTLFVTHDLDALPHTCDRVVLMKNGHIIGDGAPDKLINTETLSRLYDLPVPVVEERRPHIHRTGDVHRRDG
ncbi:MAG: metal ABC transporter ATP-binding protein [Dehalococcoidia bacterium]|nr:metal ABC transporter ATP-binding protein [Dehalococcoidia bacterium]